MACVLAVAHPQAAAELRGAAQAHLARGFGEGFGGGGGGGSVYKVHVVRVEG